MNLIFRIKYAAFLGSLQLARIVISYWMRFNVVLYIWSLFAVQIVIRHITQSIAVMEIPQLHSTRYGT